MFSIFYWISIVLFIIIQVDIKFGTRLDDLIVENKQVIGIKVSNTRDESRTNSKSLSYDAVVLAVGHSARDVYQMLLQHNVDMVPKDFAVSCYLINASLN